MKKLFIYLFIVINLVGLFGASASANSLKFPDAKEIFSQDNKEGSQRNNDVPEESTEFADADEFDEEGKRKEVKIPKGDLIVDILPKIVRLVLYAMGVLIFISFMFAGVIMVTSRGNEEQFTKVKEILLHTILGAIIVGAAFALVSGVFRALINL